MDKAVTVKTSLEEDQNTVKEEDKKHVKLKVRLQETNCEMVY